MARRIKKKKKKGISGCGIGPHQEVSPMGHATSTPTKDELRLREERRNKQSGWGREQAEQSGYCSD